MHITNKKLLASSIFACFCWSTFSGWAQPLAKEPPCHRRPTALVVRTTEHRLWLCQQGQLVAEYAVALGQGGTGKQREGDGKTPLGAYPLGIPRFSGKFHLFIPVEYPTAEQRRQGYTGGAIGIHGPARSTFWLGDLTTLMDWTQGCIALGKDGQIEEVAEWVKKHKPKLVFIE